MKTVAQQWFQGVELCIVARSAPIMVPEIRFHLESTGPWRFEHGTHHPNEAECMANAKYLQVFRLAYVARKMRAMGILEADRITPLNVNL